MKKKELAVAALESGTVIDHIPSDALFKAVKLLGIEHLDKSVTIGFNLASSRMGRKGIIKVADTTFPTEVLNRIALIAPSAIINIIEDYEVVSKQPVMLPDEIVDLVRCSNPKCVSCNEPMPSRFSVVGKNPVVLRCRYCDHEVSGEHADLK